MTKLMDETSVPYLRQSLYAGLKHIATFKALVRTGSSFLLHAVEDSSRADANKCLMVAENRKLEERYLSIAWLSLGQLLAILPVTADNNMSFLRAEVGEQVLVGVRTMFSKVSCLNYFRF